MRNIKVFFVLVSISLIFFCQVTVRGQGIPAPIPAEPPAKKPFFAYSLSPSLGLMYGQAEEILYQVEDDTKRSQLLWDMKPLFYLGAAFEMAPARTYEDRGFYATASAKFTFPMESGIMEDRDWLEVDGRSGHHYTNYSRHTADSRGTIHLDAGAGWSVPLFPNLVARFYAKFSYMRLSWEGQDGFYQYAPRKEDAIYCSEWDPSLPKISMSGVVIKYAQNWFILSPGMSFRGRVNPLFSFEWHVNCSPLIFCWARDDHPRRTDAGPRGFYDLDFMWWGLFIEEGQDIIFSPHKRFDVVLSTSLRYINGTRGKLYVKESRYDGIYKASNDAGAGLFEMEVGLSLKIHL